MITISQDKINYIISMAREVLEAAPAIVDEQLSEDHDTDHFTQENLAEIVESTPQQDHNGDSTYHELRNAINILNDEERHNLVALMWLGRGTFGRREWSSAVEQAREASNNHTAEYLMDTPLFADYLEDGMNQMDSEWNGG